MATLNPEQAAPSIPVALLAYLPLAELAHLLRAELEEAVTT